MLANLGILRVMAYNVSLTFEPVHMIMKLLSVTIQMKATEQFFPVLLFVFYAVQGGFNFCFYGKNPQV